MSGSRVQSAVLKLAQENPEFREFLKAELAKEAATRVRTELRMVCVFQGEVVDKSTDTQRWLKEFSGTISIPFESLRKNLKVKVKGKIKEGDVISCDTNVKGVELLCQEVIQSMVDNDSIG